MLVRYHSSTGSEETKSLAGLAELEVGIIAHALYIANHSLSVEVKCDELKPSCTVSFLGSL